MSQTVGAIIVLVGLVIIGRVVEHKLRRRWPGRFNSPWREPEPSLGRGVAGLILLLVALVVGTLFGRACPWVGI